MGLEPTLITELQSVPYPVPSPSVGRTIVPPPFAILKRGAMSASMIAFCSTVLATSKNS